MIDCLVVLVLVNICVIVEISGCGGVCLRFRNRVILGGVVLMVCFSVGIGVVCCW